MLNLEREQRMRLTAYRHFSGDESFLTAAADSSELGVVTDKKVHVEGRRTSDSAGSRL